MMYNSKLLDFTSLLLHKVFGAVTNETKGRCVITTNELSQTKIVWKYFIFPKQLAEDDKKD